MPPKRDLLVVGVAAALMRIFYAVLYRGSPFFHVPVIDASTFHLWAQAIQQGREFMPGAFFKPPLYPYVLAMLERLGGGGPGFAYATQAAGGVATALLVLAIGRRVFSPRAGLAAGLVMALLPIPISLEFQLLAEPWTTFLMVAGLFLLTTVAVPGASRSLRRVALAGLLLGIAALGRPNLLVLAPILAVWFWRGPVRRAAAAAALLVGFALGIAPATLHNLSQGDFVLVSANAGANLWAGIRPGADGVAAIPVGIQWDDLQLMSEQAGARGTVAADAYLARRSLTAAAGDPLRTLGLLARKALLLVNAQEGRNNIGAGYLARTQGIVVLQRWWPGFWLAMPFALLALAALAWPRRFAAVVVPAAAPFILTLAGLAAAMLPFFVNDRFRQPLLPLVALLAGHGLDVGLRAWRASGRPAILAAGVLLAAAVVVNVDWFGLDLPENDAVDELNLAGILAKGYPGHAPDLDAALAHLATAARLAPRNPDAPEREGLYLQNAAYDLLDEASQMRAQGRDPSAALAAARQRLSRALESHRKAISLYPRSFRSYGSAANCHLLLGQLSAQVAATALAAGDTTRARSEAVAAAVDLQSGLAAWQAGLQLKPNLPGGREGFTACVDLLRSLPDLDPAIAAAKARLRP